MDLELDPFDTIIPEPTSNARAGGKFQPKARPQPKKGKHAPTPAKLTDAAKDTPATTTTATEDNSHSVSLTKMSEIMTSTAVPSEPSPPNQEQVDITNSAQVDISPQPLVDKELLDREVALHSDLPIFTIGGDLQSDVAWSGRESADILFDLNDIIPESTSANVRKLQPRVKVKAQPETKLPDSCDGAEGLSENDEAPLIHESVVKDLERGLGLNPCSLTLAGTSPELVSQETLKGTETGTLDHKEDFVVDSERLGGKEQAFPGLESLNVIPQTTTTGGVQSVSETEYNDEYAYPVSYVDDYVDPAYYSDDDPVSADNASVNHSTVNVSLPAMANHASEFLTSECLTNQEDASRSNSAIPQDVVESQAAPANSGKGVKKTRSRGKKVGFALDDKMSKIHSENAEENSQEAPGERNLLAIDEKNESGKSSRQLRKRSNGPVLRDKTKGGTKENTDLSAEPSIRSLEDEDGYNDGGDKNWEDTSHRKGTAKKTKVAVKSEKPGRKRKKTSEGQDSSSKEPPKKKFSHSTRRNKRKVNKALLETPEEEIDPRKLPIRDLILLAELREQSLKKDSAVSKQSCPTQSVDNFFHTDASYDAPYDDDDPFASMGPDRDFQETERRKVNYHSFMKKTAKRKWSKQDTELFYEAIRQFGTDFSMIQQLFPDLDPDDGRRQLVLKYKNEERRNPMRLHDAVTNRSKNHSHFEQVIEKLKKLDEEQNYERDMESGGISGEEAEDNAPDTNDIAESYQKDVPDDTDTAEIPDDTDTAEIPEGDDPAQSFHEAEGDYDYKYDDYNDYNYDDDYAG